MRCFCLVCSEVWSFDVDTEEQYLVSACGTDKHMRVWELLSEEAAAAARASATLEETPVTEVSDILVLVRVSCVSCVCAAFAYVSVSANVVAVREGCDCCVCFSYTLKKYLSLSYAYARSFCVLWCLLRMLVW